MTLEEYIKHLKTLDPKFQWPLERYQNSLLSRSQIHKSFPHVVTCQGHYGEGLKLNIMEDWCREKFGHSDGKCNWSKCEMGWEYWYNKMDFESQLEIQLVSCKEHERDQIIEDHFDMIEKHPDQPQEHYHVGVWVPFFVMKTGYDYGYQDFCFKNLEDLIYFKINWYEHI